MKPMWIVACKESGAPFTTYLKGPNAGEPVLFETMKEAEANAHTVVRLGFCRPGHVEVKEAG